MSGAAEIGCEVFHIDHRAAGTERASVPLLDAAADLAGEGQVNAVDESFGGVPGEISIFFVDGCTSALGSGSCLALA